MSSSISSRTSPSSNPSSRTRVLTGITTTGTPHLGNYVGAIRPAVTASLRADTEAFYFLADLHALIKCGDPARVERSRRELAATWLAAGLDPERVTFYRQSDIPEIPQLCWLLTCVTPKGLMNRSHAYKASVDRNVETGQETDDGINMGLFSYPILMAADILMFNVHKVPVGRDQVQHIEMARDIAQRFNHLFGNGRELLLSPEASIEEDVALLPGLDGRKMSKSYDNTIPLFEGNAKQLREAISRIVTDSRLPGEAKDAEQSHLYVIYRAFATPEATASFRSALEGGMGWGDAKQALFELIDGEIAPMREKYHALMAQPAQVEALLQIGAAKARERAAPLLETLRDAVGLRSATSVAVAPTKKKKAAKLARFISFREKDGSFGFRLLAADGEELLYSSGHATPQSSGALIQQLRQPGALSEALKPAAPHYELVIDGGVIGRGPVDAAGVDKLLAELAALDAAASDSDA
ncbi:tryptophan--tRNA ligase [Pigmentiphaga aceris]|uniref:Tryptophan--tRNA ligase n=1 Tax=Pigmentiphaga aceris TaxID=1940612 RepID=A0A5C0ATH2_9BURK|nr:tryptophan--tRNA ligase [Pigmentiphaga aceris]QEI05588.1 tryptophan--tRNA ligase [Pigmentiphaga aceris]